MHIGLKIFLIILVAYVITIIVRWGLFTQWTFNMEIFKNQASLEFLFLRLDLWTHEQLWEYTLEKANQEKQKICEKLNKEKKIVSNDINEIKNWQEYKDWERNDINNNKEKILCTFDKWYKNTPEEKRKCWFMNYPKFDNKNGFLETIANHYNMSETYDYGTNC